MPTREEIVTRLVGSFQALAEPGVEVQPDTDLVTRLKLDSVKVLDVLLDIEDEYDVLIPMEAVMDVRTPADLADVVCERLGRQS